MAKEQDLIGRLADSLWDGKEHKVEEVRERLAGLTDPEGVVSLRGDTNGVFDRIEDFGGEQEVGAGSTFVSLGDVGLNYFGDFRDWAKKERLAKLPCTFFCIHGNHEQRPSEELGYRLSEYHGGAVWVEPQYPNLLFAIDGEIYDFCGQSCLVIGGAYSVDKWYRLERGLHWWPDEQPSEETRAKVERVLAERDWQVDVVLSHTCPLKYEPREVLVAGVGPSTVDKSTEEWLDRIEARLHYRRWYCGHYHTAKRVDRLQFMFEDYALLPHDLSGEGL